MADEPRPRIPIPSDWVLKRILDGKNVRLRNAVIKGDLNINQLDLPTRHIERTESQKIMGLAEDVKILQSSIKITDSTIEGNFNFENLSFSRYAGFDGTTFSEGADFNRAAFSRNGGVFEGVTFRRHAMFMGATFSGEAGFYRANFICEYTMFSGAAFSLNAMFSGATFSGYSWFNGTTFSGYAWFEGATFSGNAAFSGATFGGDCLFNKATFCLNAIFSGAKFAGDRLTFRDAAFIYPGSQEEACRRAKNVLEKNGNREEAGYHFYREMEAKRKLKGSDYSYFDYEALLICKEIDIPSRELKDLRKYLWYNIFEYFFIQIIFGYGVHPFRLWGCWWVFVGLFALLYWIGSGINNSITTQPLNFLDFLWFSITVAVTPGFAGFKPVPGFYQVVAGMEAIFGTFMWAAFIATFSRKYMR